MAKVEDEPLRKKKKFSLARKVGKAYIKRTDRKRDEVEVSPLLMKESLTGDGRLYLRQEERGTGTLIVNNSIVVHLNPTALIYLKMIFEGVNEENIVSRVTRRFKVSSSIARDDLDTLLDDIRRLEGGELPVRGTRVDPLTGPYFGPFRVDLAPTYRTKPDPKGVVPGINKGELDTEEWLKALDKIWNYGIPHICITGGEPTVREDLIEIMDHATSIGFTIGILSDGERMGNKAFTERLLDAGLAYVQITLASYDEVVHAKVTGSSHHRKTVKGIRNALKAGIPVLANIPITKESEYGLEETVRFLVDLGVRRITVNTLDLGEDSVPDWMLEKALERARKAARGRARIFWFGPVPGRDMRSGTEVEPVVELDLGNLEWGAGRTHIFIHPDGSVVANKGHGSVLGNVLTHNWNMIWYHSVLKEIRGKRLEQRRWKSLQELGLNGYPLFPGIKVTIEGK